MQSKRRQLPPPKKINEIKCSEIQEQIDGCLYIINRTHSQQTKRDYYIRLKKLQAMQEEMNKWKKKK